MIRQPPKLLYPNKSHTYEATIKKNNREKYVITHLQKKAALKVCRQEGQDER